MVSIKRNSGPDAQLTAKVRRAKSVLFWEALWSAAFPALFVAGLFLLFSLAGFFDALPRIAHIGALAAFLIAFGIALRPIFAIRPADDEAALRRIETESKIPHRPASAYRDEIAGSADDPASLTLWQAHKRRVAKLIAGLKIGKPRSDLARRDPNALRYGLVMAILVAAILIGADSTDRLQRALVPVAKNVAPLFMDAWVNPPPYTGKAPVMLARGQIDRVKEKQPSGTVIEVPVNSELLIRLNGATEPVLRLEASGHGKPPEVQEIKFSSNQPQLSQNSSKPQVFDLKLKLSRPAHITVVGDDETLAEWTFGLIDDNPPRVEVLDVGSTTDGTLNFKYNTQDDYGVSGLAAEFTLSEEGFSSAAARGSALKLFQPPNFTIGLPRVDPRAAKGEVYRDLASHPWAGLAVEMTVVARDGAGQKGAHENAPHKFVLPERRFIEPLARAVIEQRRALVANIQDSNKIARVIEAFTIYPGDLIRRSGVYLGLRSAHRAMMNARSDEDFVDVVNLLWEIALNIEDGNLSVAERELRQTRQELAKALAENAPPSEIAEIMERMRKAMDRYMRELAREMQRRMQEGQIDQNQQQLRPDQVITSQDLQKMMDQIEKLAQSGARDAAQKLLSELERLMENMRPGRMTQNGRMRNSPTAKTLQELGELMNRQQQLMDETMRMPQRGQQNGERDGQNNGQEPSDT
ncbi:MAG: TIGR02302 family protein, partial [Hyphomicrobiales bacterium]